MKGAPRPRLIIAVLSGLFSVVLLPLATNIATSTLPQWIQPYTWLAWPVLVVLATFTITLITVEVKSDRPPDDVTELAIANRERMLAKVRRVWIDGHLLKDSLYNLVRIELGLEETSDAVSRRWDLIVQPPNQAPRPLPPGQAMSAVFDELDQALIILGAPGAGKTTLLLELTRYLLDRAVEDATHPIPVVFHLSTWVERRRPLADWLVDELESPPYYVQRKLAQAWVDAEQVLLLLDGLDEVAPEHRAACVEAINTFRRRHGQVPLALCCRTADYEALRTRAELFGAVIIQPLSREQIRSYLKRAGKALAGVRTVLRDDETLWELLETPLMLSIVALAYQGRSAAEVRATGSLEQRRAHLFENYTQRMFERRTKVTEYTPDQTIRWLTWLARSLMHNNLNVFYVERMQPNWLPSCAQRQIVANMPIMVFGLVFALLGGMVFGVVIGPPFGWLVGLVLGPLHGLVLGWLVWLLGGLVFRLLGRLTADQIVTRAIPNEEIRLLLRNALMSLLTGGMVFGLLGGMIFGLFYGLLGGMVFGLFYGLLGGMIFGLQNGGSHCLDHYVLRFLLWCNGYAPWNYIRFLDHAAERVFLRKVGGGYIFTHRLLMEYFAALQPTDHTRQTETT